MKFEEACKELFYEECDYIGLDDDNSKIIFLTKEDCLETQGDFSEEDFNKNSWTIN